MYANLKSSVLAHCKNCDKLYPIEDFVVTLGATSQTIADKYMVINLDNIFNTFNVHGKPIFTVKCPACGYQMDIIDDIYAPYVKAFYELGIRNFNCSSGGFPNGVSGCYQDAFIRFETKTRINTLFIEYDGYNSLSYKVPTDFELQVENLNDGWYRTYIFANVRIPHSRADINAHDVTDMDYYVKVKNFYMYILYRLSNIGMLSLVKADKKNLSRDHQELIDWGYGSCKNIEAGVLDFLNA